MKISVVCPFYNEEAIIAAATRRMIGNLENQFDDWELILVNDGSRDRSLEVLLASLGTQQKRVNVISCAINQGRGRALKNGIDAATGEIIVTTEADCSWGDNIVKLLFDELQQNPDAHFVIASPHMKGGGLVNVPLKRVLLTKLGNYLINMFFMSGVSMNTGMTRAYRAEVIKPLVVWENGKEFHLEVLLKLRTLNFRVREIPAVITWQDHKLTSAGANKRKSSTKILKTIATHLRFIAVAQPMAYFGIAAAVSVLFGALFLGWAFRNLLTGDPAIYFALIGLIMFLFALLFTGFSVLFIELRETMRDQWMGYYNKSNNGSPPSKLSAEEISHSKLSFDRAMHIS